MQEEVPQLKVDKVLFNWEASLLGEDCKARKLVSWAPQSPSALKFNVDGSTKGKPGLEGCHETVMGFCWPCSLSL